MEKSKIELLSSRETTEINGGAGLLTCPLMGFFAGYLIGKLRK